MSDRERPIPFWLVGVIVGAFAAVVAMGPQTLVPALVFGGAALGWALWRRWRSIRSASSVLTGLRAHWATLPGATLRPNNLTVHHGEQPLLIHLGHAPGHPLRARISTPIGELPMAFRVWPKGTAAPSLIPDGRAGSTPTLYRSAMVESWLAGRLSAESNDEERLLSLIDKETTAALLSMMEALDSDFEGLAYDGQFLTVMVRGSVVADPERSLQVARTVWRTFTP